MPSVEVLKASDSTREKKIPNRVGARTQPCLIPLLMGKAFVTASSFFVLPGISVHLSDETTKLQAPIEAGGPWRDSTLTDRGLPGLRRAVAVQ